MTTPLIKPPHGPYHHGRLPMLPDTRDYLARPLLAAAPPDPEPVTHRRWNPGEALDQGPTSRCVAYAWLGMLAAGPVTNRKGLPDPADVYRLAQQLDEWPGEEPVYEGSSTRGGAKAAQQLGFLTSYAFASDAATAVEWILRRGPVVFGTCWTDSMYEPQTFRGDKWLHID